MSKSALGWDSGAWRVAAERVTDVLFFLFFLACSAPAVSTLGGVSFSTAELTAFALIVWLLLTRPDRGRSGPWHLPPLVWVVWGFVLWASLLWLFSSDWTERRDWLQAWVLAAALLTALVASGPRNWRRIATLFVVAVLPSILVGMAQHFAWTSGRGKTLLGWGQAGGDVPVRGFFDFGDNLGAYLYWPLLLSLGLAIESRRFLRVLFGLLGALTGLTLYWTFARGALLAALLAILAMVGMRLIPRKRMFALAALGVLLAGMGALFVITRFVPLDRLLTGRPRLWSISLRTILSDPYFLVLGLQSVPAKWARVWWTPHNIYLLAWLQYGVAGVLLLVSLAVYLVRSGWVSYAALRREPVLSSLWTGMLGMLLVSGMTNLYLNETYIQLTFVALLAMLLGLRTQHEHEGKMADGAVTGREETSPAPA